MSNLIDRATSLLFPAAGRRALDVKFYITPGATQESLAEQTIVCLTSLEDQTRVIEAVDL